VRGKVKVGQEDASEADGHGEEAGEGEEPDDVEWDKVRGFVRHGNPALKGRHGRTKAKPDCLVLLSLYSYGRHRGRLVPVGFAAAALPRVREPQEFQRFQGQAGDHLVSHE